MRKLTILLALLITTSCAISHPTDLSDVKPADEYNANWTGDYKSPCPRELVEQIECGGDAECAEIGTNFEVAHQCYLSDLEYYY